MLSIVEGIRRMVSLTEPSIIKSNAAIIKQNTACALRKKITARKKMDYAYLFGYNKGCILHNGIKNEKEGPRG
jgi:hypothetical protein